MPVRRLKGKVAFRFVNLGERRRIINLGSGAEMLQLRIVNKRQPDKADRRSNRADDNKWCAPPARTAASIGNHSEQRQKKNRKDIIQRHYKTGPCLRHSELVRENQRYRIVVGLPECADKKECKAYADRSFVVEFHDSRRRSRVSFPLKIHFPTISLA